MRLEDGSDFTWWKNPQFKITSNGSVVKSYQANQVIGQSSREKLIYDNIYNGISEEFVILNGGIENNIILNSLTSEISSLSLNANLEFSQFIPLNSNWSVFNAEGKKITTDAQTTNFSIQLGNSTIYFGKIVVFDNNISKEDAMLINAPFEKLSQLQKQQLTQSVYSITYQIKFVNGGIEIISALPASWVNQPNRAFPVVIDPTVTITPTSPVGNFYGPMTHWYGYQRYANLYLQSEIGVNGMITDIEYNRTSTLGSAGSRPTKIYMSTTPNATLSAGAWNSAGYTGGAQLCLDENTDQGSTAGWKNLHLTSPFLYGQDNLMIMVHDAWGGGGSTKWYNQSTTPTQRQAYNRVDNTDPGDAVNLLIEDRLPEIRITYIPAVECTGLPSSATATSNVTEVCVNSPFTLSLSGMSLESGLSIQWQSSTDGGTTWSNLGTAQTTLSYSVPTQSVPTDYKAVITCVPTGDVLESSVVSVDQSAPANCYCINTIPANCTDGDVITNVTIESINNNSTCGNSTTGYSNYTTTVAPAQLEIGSTIPMSVTVGPSGDGWLYESVGVWIDYNQNGVLDSLEGEYTNLGTGLNQVITNNIIIPSTALPGPTRMRVVVMASQNMLNSFVCGPVLANNNFGEIEDYTVNLFAATIIEIDSVVVTTQGNVPAEITTPSGTLQLEAAVYPLTENQNVTWSVIPVSGGATISTGGLVTAQTDGTVWAKAISVEDNTKADSILITITNQVVVAGIDSVVVTTQGNIPAQITTLAGTLQLEAAVYPLTENQNVTWSIIPVSGGATISTGGLVTAQTDGTVWAKAISVEDNTKADSILITITNQVVVVGIDSVVVTTQGGIPANISTPAGTLQLAAAVYPLTENQNVTWSIIPVSGGATISTGGLVTAQSNGTVWAKAISVEDNTKADSILITITNQDLGLTDLNLADFTIFPNPTSDIVVLKSGVEHSALQVSVIDLTGKVIFQDNLIDNELNNGYQVKLENNSSGVYIIQLKNDQINIQRHIIKK